MSDTTRGRRPASPRPERAGDEEGIPPADPVPPADVRHRVPGPQQRLVRAEGIRGRLRHQRRRVRVRRRPLLRRLRHLRGSQQPPAAQGRGALVAGPDHGELGHHCGRLHVRAGADELLHPAVPARCRRGGLLPRRHPLPHLLDPRAAPEPGARLLLYGHRARRHPGQPAVGRTARAQRVVRTARHSVDVPHRGFAGRRRGRVVLLLPDRQAEGREVAAGRRAAGAGGDHRGRGHREGGGARTPEGARGARKLAGVVLRADLLLHPDRGLRHDVLPAHAGDGHHRPEARLPGIVGHRHPLGVRVGLGRILPRSGGPDAQAPADRDVVAAAHRLRNRHLRSVERYAGAGNRRALPGRDGVRGHAADLLDAAHGVHDRVRRGRGHRLDQLPGQPGRVPGAQHARLLQGDPRRQRRSVLLGGGSGRRCDPVRPDRVLQEGQRDRGRPPGRGGRARGRCCADLIHQQGDDENEEVT